MDPKTTKSGLAGTITSLIAASSASGGVVSGLTASISGNQFADWDIDNNGVEEFAMAATTNSSTALSSFSANLVFQGSNGAFLATPGNAIASLTANAVVSGGQTFYNGSFYAFSNPFSFNSKGLTFIGEEVTATIGFRFLRDGQTHYGIADFEYSVNSGSGVTGATMEFSNVFWNDTPGQGITASGAAIPEPNNAALGLGALALGAAGLRRWRRQKATA